MKDIISLCNSKISKSSKIAFMAAIIIGFITHTYIIVNNFINHDALYNYYSDQNMIASGRWFLSAACGLSSYFNLPWLIGIMAIVYIAVTALLLTDIFKVKNTFVAVLIGGILVVYPAIAETFYYKFTADGFVLAMLLATLGVKFTTIRPKQPVIYTLISIVCICLSCAIYQAYLAFALVLATCYFIKDILENNHSVKKYLSWIIMQAGIYASAVGLYYIVWKIILKVNEQTATTYYGMDTVGAISVNSIISAAKLSIESFVKCFVGGIGIEGFSIRVFINIAFVAMSALVLLICVVKTKIYRQKIKFILMVTAFAVIPFFSHICMFVLSEPQEVDYGVRMQQCVCLLYILFAVLASKLNILKLKAVLSIVLVAFIFNNIVSANIYYLYIERVNKHDYAMATEIAERIHENDDGNVKNIAIIGSYNRNDVNMFLDDSASEKMYHLLIMQSIAGETNLCLFMYHELGFELTYYRNHTNEEIPIIERDVEDASSFDWDFRFPVLSGVEREQLENSDLIKRMPCWPHKDSVQVLEDTVVVKLSNPQ